jgi:hypothetical protein
MVLSCIPTEGGHQAASMLLPYLARSLLNLLCLCLPYCLRALPKKLLGGSGVIEQHWTAASVTLPSCNSSAVILFLLPVGAGEEAAGRQRRDQLHGGTPRRGPRHCGQRRQATGLVSFV